MTASDTSRLAGRVTALLGELVGYPTVSTTSNEALLRWLGDRCEELGAVVDITMSAGDRGNLLARFGPAAAGGVMLSGHTDVVPPGAGWATDPWTLTAVGARLCGRGAADMKGFFAAALVALQSIDVAELVAPCYLLASYDEEIGCRGVRDVLPTLAADDHIDPTLIVVGEPTMMRPRHSHLGKRVTRVVVRAAEGHSSRAASQPNAISVMSDLIQVLDEIQPAAGGDSTEIAPYVVNYGAIAGGSQPNVIAAQCELDFEVRFDVDHDPDVVLAPFTAAVERARRRLDQVGGGIELETLVEYPAMATDPAAPDFAGAARLADAGPSTALGFGTEGGLLAAALDAAVMICGPGDIAVAHRPDEYVTVEQLERCTDFLTALITSRCRRKDDPTT